jgi:hypothetical protein
MKRGLVASLVGLLCLSAAPALSAVRTYVVAVGNNAPPVRIATEEALSTLRYADDDAASLVRLGREVGADTTLLSVLDEDSRRRFPELAQSAEPPTLSALRRVVARLKQSIESDLARGDEPIVIFFYSGHGILSQDAPPALSLLDAPLTRAVLYDDILAPLPARYIHLIIDACHAEAVVRPRDARAESSTLSDAEREAYETRATLRRFPNVGAVIATSSSAQAHEWDVYQRGIFSYQVMSGLRGAADTNGDGSVEYSELYAFLGAANAQVADPRARLSVVVRPPPLNPSAPILDSSAARTRQAQLSGPWPSAQGFFVEDERGNRLLEMRPESGFRFRLLLPSDQVLYLRSGALEARLEIKPGDQRAISKLQLATPRARARGALEASLVRGLFVTPFGPAYYRGFVDARPELSPVRPGPPEAPEPLSSAATASDRMGSRSPTLGIVVVGGAAALTVASVIASVSTISARSRYDATTLERPATEARRDFTRDRALAIGTGVGAALLGGVGVWLLWPSKSSQQLAAGLRLDGEHRELSARLVW